MKFIRRLRLALFALTLTLAGSVFGQASSSNTPVFMYLTGDKQGPINGEVTQKGRENQHYLLAYSHEIVVPRDSVTGLPSGKRQHQPFRVVKLLNKASPLLLTALTSNENLPTVVIDVWTVGITSAEIKLMTYTLTNARIVSIRPWMPNRADSSAQNYPPAEEVAFVYQKITVKNHPTGAESVDDWSTLNP